LCSYFGTLKEFAAIKNRVKEMEEEAAKLKQLQAEMEQQMQLSNPSQSMFLLFLTTT
jgi:hypothetical protein